MKLRAFAAGILTVAAVVLAVTSCAPAVQSTSAPTARPHVTAKPHPSPTQASIPSVRVPLTCASLLSDAAAATIMGSPVKAHRDETTLPVDITDVASRQYGSLDCLWGGDREDSGYDQDVSIDIAPDAAAGFAANLSNFASQDGPTTSNTAGDQSVYGCTVDADLHCTANMLVGSFWVTAYIQNLGGTPISQSIANARIQQVLTAVAPPLTTATAGKAWIPPNNSLPTFCSASGSTTQVNTALGVSDFAVVGEDDQVADASSYAQTAGVYTQCAWSGAESEPFTYLSIGMLRGGAWVLPLLPGHNDPKSYMLGAYTSMTVPGTNSAAGDCSTAADECEVAVAIGSLLVVIGMDDPSDAQSSAAIAKVVAAIKAS
jgi:hypothetical protein